MSSNINEVKSIIRGLLTSCPEEMNVGRLRHDYRNQEGIDIPFYEFKFRDVTSFLRSIPDVCQICDNPYGPHPIVRLVESEKSAHISSLVMRQRISGKARQRRSNVTVHGRVSYKIPHSSAKKTSKPIVHRLSQSATSHCSSIKPTTLSGKSQLNAFAPEFSFKTTLPAVSSLGSDATSWDLEDQDISENEDNNQNPDPILREKSDDSSTLELHLHQILSNREGLTLQELEIHLKESLSTYGCNITLEKGKIEEILARMVDFVIKENKVYYVNSCLQPLDNVAEVTFKNQENMYTETSKEDLNVSIEDDHSKGHSYPFTLSEGNDKVQKLERNLYALIKDCPDGILLSELMEKYKFKFAAPLNLNILGCKSMEELVHKMKYIFSSVELENRETKLYPAWLPKVQKLSGKKMSTPNSKMFDIPILIKRNVQWLMQGYPNGLHSKDFKQTYKDTFYGEVDLNEMGFSTSTDFFNALELDGIIQICISDSDIWLLPSKSPIESAVDQDPLPPMWLGEFEDDMNLLKEKFPNDVVGPDMHIEQEKIPLWVQTGSMIEIFVQELRNPHNFWVTFVGEQCTSALEILMDDLQAFYCTRSPSYRMPFELVRKGQDCVTQFSGEWNRARVIRLINSNEVEVLFFDYGTQSVVQGNALYFLHTSFSKLPAQAIRAVMANIAPVGATWSKDASKRFLSLIADRPLIGIVHNVDRQSCILSLFLCDTNGDDDVYIANVLVSEGYAIEIKPNVQTVEENDAGVLKCEVLDGALSRNETDNMQCTLMERNAEGKMNSFTNEDIICLSPRETLCLENSVDDLERTSPSSNVASSQQIHHNFTISSQQIQDKFSFSTLDIAKPVNSSPSDLNLSDQVLTKSDTVASKVAPPPGFCHSSKTKDVNDETDLPKSSDCSVTRNKEKDYDCDINENKKVLESSTKTSDSKSLPKNITYSPKSVNSGVNANFSEEFKTFPGNTPNSMGWTPPMYPNIPAFHPPHMPLDLNTCLPPYPFGYPFPNPFDFYSLWYYEQMRQQAIMRGAALAHTNLNAHVLPPLPSGLLIPSNQNVGPPIYSNNQMLISEVQSPPKTVEKIDSTASTTSTQTEELLDDNLTQMSVDSLLSTDSCALKPVSSTVIDEVDLLHFKESGVYQSSKGLQTESISSAVPQILSEKDITESCAEQISDSGNISTSKSNTNPNNQMTFSLRKTSIQSQLQPLTNSLLEYSSEHETKLNVLANGENKTTETGNFSKISCFQLSKGKNNQRNDVENHTNVREILGECKSTNKGSDILGNNPHCVKDKITGGSAKNEGQNLILDVSCDSSLSAQNLKGSNPFTERYLVDGKSQVSTFKLSKKKLTPKDTNAKCSNIVLNPFSSTLSNFEPCRDNFQKNSNKNVFNVELNPFFSHEKQTSGIGIQLDGVSELTCRDEVLQCSEFEPLQGSDSFMCLDRHRSSLDIQSEKVLPSMNCNYDSIMDSQNSDTTEERLSASTNMVPMESQLKITCPNNQKNICMKEHNNFATPSELLDSFKNIGVKDNTKSLVSLHDTEVISSQKNPFSHFNKNNSESSTVGVSEKTLRSFSEEEIEGSQVSVNDDETKSKTMHHEFPESCVKRIVSKFPVDNVLHSSQNSDATGMGRNAHDAPWKTKNTSLSETTPSWTTTWGTDRITSMSSSKSNTKTTIADTILRNSVRNGGIQSYDYISTIKNNDKPTFVKKINLLEHSIHLINMDGRPYIPTDEIVRNFTSFNGHHVVLKILDARKIEINFLELCRRRRPDIFECLDKTDMKFVSRGPTGNIIGSLHTIPLRSIPYMLKALNRDNTAITEAVQKALANFDPNDHYWKGHTK